MNITSIADELFRELSDPTDCSIPSIAFWLTSNIGRLNTLIGSSYEIVSDEISPALGEAEKSIFKLLYLIVYYQRQVSKNLGAAAYQSIAEVKEGDKTVRRANKTQVAQTYRLLVLDLNEDLAAQLMNYKMLAASPEQFIVDNPVLTELPSQTSTTSVYSSREY